MTKEEHLKEHENLFYDGIKNIEITFENCEIVIIPRNMIGQIIIKDFKKEFIRMALNSIDFIDIAKYIVIQIKEKDQAHKPNLWGMEVEDNKTIPLIERIKYNDITNIRVNYLWDETYSWYVDYNEKATDIIGTSNILQTTKECFEDIWIAIGEKAQKDLDEYLPESKESRDFTWEMYELND